MICMAMLKSNMSDDNDSDHDRDDDSDDESFATVALDAQDDDSCDHVPKHPPLNL